LERQELSNVVEVLKNTVFYPFWDILLTIYIARARESAPVMIHAIPIIFAARPSISVFRNRGKTPLVMLFIPNRMPLYPQTNINMIMNIAMKSSLPIWKPKIRKINNAMGMNMGTMRGD